MEVLILRASINDSKTPPCKGAYRKAYTYIDERTVDDPEKSGDSHWYTDGTNHRVEDGHAKRDLVRNGWFIKINNLWKFAAEHGELAILAGNPKTVEICDTWRE